MNSHTLYVACAEDQTIHTLTLHADGQLTPTAITPVPGATGPAGSLPLALSADRTRLYAALRCEPNSLASFAIAPDGGLTPLATAPLPHSLAYISAVGDSLLGASYHGGVILRAAIGPDGAVHAAPTQILPTPPNPHCILAAPDGAIHVPSLGGDTILRYTLIDGHLAATGEARTAKGAGPRHLVFAPPHAYSLNELDATIDAWRLEDGNLQQLQTVATLPPGITGRIAAADIHLTRDGRFLYASERLTNILSAWRRDPTTGHLTHIADTEAEATPRGFAIDPTGQWLVCAGQTSHHVATYRIDPATGAPAFVMRIKVGANPNWIEYLS